MNNISPRARFFRLLFRALGILFAKIMTRTMISGLENIPATGAVIFAGNHVSTYDAMMALMYLPSNTQIVGPGDFRFKWPARLAVEETGIILAKRGSADRESLSKMTDVLKSGGRLALFPEGGTWEKRLDDVKPGAAYLSYTCNTPIVPIAIGGTYQIWQQIFRFKRPKISMIFLPPMPPVEITDRKQRQEKLQQASLELMQHIYEYLPATDQALYDLHARQLFHGKLETIPATLPIEENFSVLAELISKPNLFHPLHEQAKKEFAVFQSPHPVVSAKRFQIAVEKLDSLLHHHFPDYLEYRLGSIKAKRGLEEVSLLKNSVVQAAELDLAVRFVPSVTIADSPLPANM